MVSLEQVRHTIDLLSLLEKATGKYPEPKVKPPSAVKYDWNWNTDTGHWVSENGEEHEDQENSKIDEEDITPIDNVPTKIDPPKREYTALSDIGYDEETRNKIRKQSILSEKNIQQEPSYTSVQAGSSLGMYIDEYHKNINHDIRNGTITDVAREIKSLMKPMGKKGATYRGTGLSLKNIFPDNNLSEGHVIQLKSFASTSRDPELAWNWNIITDFGEPTVMFEMHYNETTSGMSISNKDTHLGEFETIFDYGQRFEVVEVREEKIGFNEVNEAFNDRTRPVVVLKITEGYDDRNDIHLMMIKAQPRIKPAFAEKHGFEWDENKKRWVQSIGV